MRFEPDRMPKTYRVGRIVLSVMTAVLAYLGLSNAVVYVCVSTVDEFHVTHAVMFAISVAVSLIPISGFYGAINHHVIALFVYIGSQFLLSILLSIVINLTVMMPLGGHIFTFIWWNATFTLLPAYLVYNIKNADKLMIMPMVE
ncbi:hypothetical protein HDE_08400 [Halotydeus destructor]|nr:hypothetical protein HDE_08400 [Halotydeus destructor]